MIHIQTRNWIAVPHSPTKNISELCFFFSYFDVLHPLCEAPSISNDIETFLFINVVRLQYMIYDTMYHFDKKEKKSRKLQLLSLKSFISGGEKQTNKHTQRNPNNFIVSCFGKGEEEGFTVHQTLTSWVSLVIRMKTRTTILA